MKGRVRLEEGAGDGPFFHDWKPRGFSAFSTSTGTGFAFEAAGWRDAMKRHEAHAQVHSPSPRFPDTLQQTGSRPPRHCASR
jgi:hypothetical protein